jgi:hypothetical protein
MSAQWKDICTAPYNIPVRIKAGKRRFPAILRPDASLDEHEQPCDQWLAVEEDNHPRDWCDGCCWDSNSNGVASTQPTGWQPLATPTRGISGDEHAGG